MVQLVDRSDRGLSVIRCVAYVAKFLQRRALDLDPIDRPGVLPLARDRYDDELTIVIALHLEYGQPVNIGRATAKLPNRFVEISSVARPGRSARATDQKAHRVSERQRLERFAKCIHHQGRGLHSLAGHERGSRLHDFKLADELGRCGADFWIAVLEILG